MIQKISLIPGEIYEGTITISNGAAAKENLLYSIQVAPYNVKTESNNQDDYDGFDIETMTAHNKIVDWIEIVKDDTPIQPNESSEVIFRINVPHNAPAGAQYAALLFSNVNDDKIEVSGTAVKDKVQLASVLYANIAGETIEKGSILENSIPSFLTTGPLEATSMVRNEGNIYTDAEYILQVWPLFSNEEICTNEEEPETSLVLPETERYHAQSCNLPTVGIFRAKQTVKIFGETSIVEKTIIVCPIWLLFIILFAIFALIFYIIMKVRSHKKSARKPQAQTQ